MVRRFYHVIHNVVWIAVLALPGRIWAQELKPTEIYERLTPSVLTLKVLNTKGERYTGSAFFALQQGVAVTAWHTVHDAQYVHAYQADGTRFEVSGLVDRDEEHDLALIGVAPHSGPLAPLSRRAPTIGSRLYVLGAPKGFGFSIADGLLSQVQIIDGFQQYQISCPLSTGNSGGPVIDDFGEVIGVASWSRLDAQNINFAVPVELVRRMDPTRPPVSWEQAKGHETDQPSPGDSSKLSQAEDDLTALRGYLKRAAGRKITIIIQEEEENKRFSFIVPE